MKIDEVREKNSRCDLIHIVLYQLRLISIRSASMNSGWIQFRSVFFWGFTL